MEFARLLDVLRAFERGKVEYGWWEAWRSTCTASCVRRRTSSSSCAGDAGNVERLKTALRSLWDDPEIDEIGAEDFESYPTLRYGPPDEALVIDVLTGLGTAVRYEDLESEVLVVDGVSVRVATPRTLVRMKQSTIRPIDKADAAALVRLFHLEGT